MLLSPTDILALSQAGISTTTAEQQIQQLRHGLPMLKVEAAATVPSHILRLSTQEQDEMIALFDRTLMEGQLQVAKFVPASGAASRMFKSLLSWINDNDNLNMPLWKSVAMVLVGLAILIYGGSWLVDGASGIATKMGVSQSIIALTIVSIGTSAPELAASIMAARKGDTAMALGNVVGSVVFNVFFVLGTAATICPLSLGNITGFDIATLLVASVMLWCFCKTHTALVKWEGVVLLLIQVLYYVILVINEQHNTPLSL